MNKSNIALIISGDNYQYKEYIKDLHVRAESHNAKLVAIVDTSKSAKSNYRDIIMSGVKYFDSISAMFNIMKIDITVIASHEGLHSTHACMALENDSHVMIMKPLAGCVYDSEEIMHIAKITRKKVFVGYESLYDNTIKKVKDLILGGTLGGLIDMKMICFTPKDNSYFNNGVNGQISDTSGRLIMNSVVSKDAANHILNLLYFAGDEISSLGKIEELDATLFKTNDIETFDTCAIKAQLVGGIGMLAIASQTTLNTTLKYILWFERGYIECNGNKWTVYYESSDKAQDIGTMNIDYMKPIWDMIDSINGLNDKSSLIDGVLEHIKIIEQLGEISVEETTDYGKSLEETLLNCYDNYCLP